jgi:hypothetical protein
MVRKLDPERDRFVISFDVESLYINIPTTETIDILLDLGYGDDKKQVELETGHKGSDEKTIGHLYTRIAFPIKW